MPTSRTAHESLAQSGATIAARGAIARESFASASEAIGPITAGADVFCLTRGQWSMIDAVLHVLDCVGPSEISLWTWSIAEYEVQVLSRLRADERLTGATLVIDGGMRGKNAHRKTGKVRDQNLNVIHAWRERFGPSSVRYCVNHAKIARIHSASGLRVLCRGSMNLNFNPRFEQFDLREGRPCFDLVAGVEAVLPVIADDAPRSLDYAASRVSAAFDAGSLAAFSRVKVWAK